MAKSKSGGPWLPAGILLGAGIAARWLWQSTIGQAVLFDAVAIFVLALSTRYAIPIMTRRYVGSGGVAQVSPGERTGIGISNTVRGVRSLTLELVLFDTAYVFVQSIRHGRLFAAFLLAAVSVVAWAIGNVLVTSDPSDAIRQLWAADALAPGVDRHGNPLRGRGRLQRFAAALASNVRVDNPALLLQGRRISRRFIVGVYKVGVVGTLGGMCRIMSIKRIAPAGASHWGRLINGTGWELRGIIPRGETAYTLEKELKLEKLCAVMHCLDGGIRIKVDSDRSERFTAWILFRADRTAPASSGRRQSTRSRPAPTQPLS